jgi:pimeloyl-ACP methyl ester carboxylesterase
LLPGCVTLTSGTRPDTAAPPSAATGLVFVVDGAGGFDVCSHTIRQTAAEDRMPLEVRVFRWTHGYCRVLADQIHSTHLRRAGRLLSDLVLACRKESPGRPIFLVGHSAGCGVVLAAAENLPPDTVERIVLLAPAVSSKKDLRTALASTCRGIDVFYSSRDWVCLGLGTLLAGTTDRCWTLEVAGKVGFRSILNGPEDEALYAKLRQYPWDSSLTWAGHKGGHYGSHQPGFLRAFVLPLLVPQPSAIRFHLADRCPPIADR